MENTIKANTTENTNTEHMTEGAAQTGMGVIVAMAAMIGIWGTACLISGIAQGGIVEMARSFMTAVTGM